LYFKQHRNDYYDLLNYVRESGDWEAWLAFFLEGVKVTAEGAVGATNRLVKLFESDRAEIVRRAGGSVGSVLRVYDALRETPILSIGEVSDRANLSFATASSVMRFLAEQGIAREITGRSRGRLFAYDRYIAILNEGTEPP